MFSLIDKLEEALMYMVHIKIKNRVCSGYLAVILTGLCQYLLICQKHLRQQVTLHNKKYILAEIIHIIIHIHTLRIDI